MSLVTQNKLGAFALTFVAVASLAATARAEAWSDSGGTPSTPSSGGGSLEQATLVNLGVGSAVGEIGFTHALFPAKALELEGGVGLGATGLQLSVMPKLVIGGQTHRITMGLGLGVSSTGSTLKTDQERALDQPGQLVLPWINYDVIGYEYRSPSGFMLSTEAGITLDIAHGQVQSYGAPGSLLGFLGEGVAQLRIGIGRWN